MKKEAIKYKINPSLEQIGKTIYVGEKLVRSRSREGKFKGTDAKINIKEFVEGFEEINTFIKVYDSAYKVITSLSKTGRIMLDYILHKKLDYGKHEFIMFVKEYMVDNDVSEKTTYNAINELIEKGIIYCSDISDKYFLNLEYFCRGSIEEIYEKYKRLNK
jgi:hypothetical protein